MLGALLSQGLTADMRLWAARLPTDRCPPRARRVRPRV